MERSGDQIFNTALQMQSLVNETEARNATIQFSSELGDLHAKFNSLEGMAARDAFPKYRSDITALFNKYRSGMSNPASAKMFDGEAQPQALRSVFNGAGHAATQTHQAADQSIDSSINLKMVDIYNNGYYPGWENELTGLVQKKRDLKGWDDETAAKYLESVTSKANAHYLVGLAKREPLRAADEYKETYKGRLEPDDDIHVQNALTQQGRLVVSRIAAQQELARKTDDPPEVRADKAVEEAQKRLPEDNQIDWYTRNAFYTLLGKQQAQQKAVARQNTALVDKALGDETITDPDMLMASDPKVAAAWEQLGGQEKKKFLAVMKAHAVGDKFETPEMDEAYHEIIGWAREHPAEFLDTAITSLNDGNLSKRYRDHLYSLQDQIRIGADKDPRVQRALTELGGDMLRENLRFNQDPKGFYKFRGALEDAIRISQHDNKKPPDRDEVLQIGRLLLQHQFEPRNPVPEGTTVGWWNQGLYGKRDVGRTFELGKELTARQVDKIADEEEAQGRVRPNRDQVERLYAAEQFRRLYGKKIAPPAEGKGVVTLDVTPEGGRPKPPESK